MTRGFRRGLTGLLSVLAIVSAATLGVNPGSGRTASEPAARAASTPQLVSIRATHIHGADRVVFEFAGGLPSRRTVRHVKPLIADPSGLPVRIAGRAILEVNLHPASGHSGSGKSTAPGRIAFALANVINVAPAGDFEGVLSYGTGLAKRPSVHLFTLTRPSRVRASAVLISLGALVLAASPLAVAATAPSKAIRVAVGKAREQFRTQRVHPDFSLLSRRDPRWALVDGTATARPRLWAAWLHNDGKANWKLRYLDTTAPFQPQSTQRGRVPCDLYPAFSEALCPPSGPSATQIKAQVFKQLVPSGNAAKIGTLLRHGSYTFIFKPPVNGTLVIAWYLLPKGAHITAPGPKSTLARGTGDFFGKRPGKVTIKLTAAGKQLFKSARTLKLTAKGTFTPILYRAFSTTRTFTLTR